MGHAFYIVESIDTNKYFPTLEGSAQFRRPPSHGSALQRVSDEGGIDADREDANATEPPPELDPFRRRRRDI